MIEPYIPPQHGKDCLANVRECRENQRKYPEHLKSAIIGENDWMQEHILSGGNVGDLMQDEVIIVNQQTGEEVVLTDELAEEIADE